MVSIWDKLAYDDQQRWRRLSVTLGVTWIAVAVVGTVVVLAVGRPDKISGGIIMMLIGLLMIIPAVTTRGRKHRRH